MTSTARVRLVNASIFRLLYLMWYIHIQTIQTTIADTLSRYKEDDDDDDRVRYNKDHEVGFNIAAGVQSRN